jgi:hypothetical protein
MEERVRSRSEIRQYLSRSFLGRGPEGDVVAPAKGGMNWEALPKLGGSLLLDKDEMGKYIPRLTREEVDCGHWALWERAAEVNALVGTWLEEKVFAAQ